MPRSPGGRVLPALIARASALLVERLVGLEEPIDAYEPSRLGRGLSGGESLGHGASCRRHPRSRWIHAACTREPARLASDVMRDRKVGSGPTSVSLERGRTSVPAVGKRTLVEPLRPAPGQWLDNTTVDGAARERPSGRDAPEASEVMPGPQLGDGLAIARSATAPAPSDMPSAVSATLASAKGAALPNPEQWSARVGADVSAARVVTGEGAPEAASSISARAFTVGNRVFMGAGNDTGTDGGNLLAHELTHVAQQQGAATPGSWDQLRFVDHSDHREVAARAHDGRGHGSGEQAIARDVAPDVDAAAYRRTFAAQIGKEGLRISRHMTCRPGRDSSRFRR